MCILGCTSDDFLISIPTHTHADHQDKYKEGCDNFISVLPGDFIYPSLLSSLDGGHGMVDVLNKCGLDYVYVQVGAGAKQRLTHAHAELCRVYIGVLSVSSISCSSRFVRP